MKLAILGGSFNPLHIGHAMMADTMIKEFGYDKVLFVPTYLPPHKEILEKNSAQQRFEMVKSFCNSIPNNIFEVETCEIERKGISYTIDTLEYIIEKYKNLISEKPALLMGEEIAAEFEKWKEPKKISEISQITIFPRNQIQTSSNYKNKPSGNYKGDFNVKFDKTSFKFPCVILDSPIVSVSSTEIRNRIAENKSFEYLVPKSVYEYIINNKLYK